MPLVKDAVRRSAIPPGREVRTTTRGGEDPANSIERHVAHVARLDAHEVFARNGRRLRQLALTQASLAVDCDELARDPIIVRSRHRLMMTRPDCGAIT